MSNLAKWMSLLSALACSFNVAAAPAATPAPAVKDSAADDDPANNTTYAGIGFASVTAKGTNASAATNLTGDIGIHPKGVDWVALELELGTTVSSGDVSGSGPDRHFSVQHGAVFGALRTPGVVYGMGRIGYQYINTGLQELSGHHSGAAWSLGAGWRIRPQGALAAELLYTHVSNNVQYWGLRLNYGFGASTESEKKSDRYLDH